MISGRAVVDASVVVEQLVALPHSAAVDAVFTSVVETGAELWAPDLVYVETASALKKLVARRHIGAAAAKKSLGWLARLPLVAVGTSSLLGEIWDLRDTLSAYDASYVALARRLRAPLVTLDKRLAAAARRRGCEIVIP